MRHARRTGDGARAVRSDLQPGQPGRRLHRHDARGLRELRAWHRRTGRASTPSASCSAATISGRMPGRRCRAEAAMAKAEVMVDAYVAAGFRKIHLDCSMSCAGDPAPLPERDRRARAVRLCARRRTRMRERRRRAAGVCHRHRSSRPRWRDGSASDTLAVTTPEAARCDDRGASHGLRRRGARRRLAARDRLGRAARRGVRPPQCRSTTRPRRRARSAAIIDAMPRHGLRGALHRLPDAATRCARSCRITSRSSRWAPA